MGIKAMDERQKYTRVIRKGEAKTPSSKFCFSSSDSERNTKMQPLNKGWRAKPSFADTKPSRAELKLRWRREVAGRAGSFFTSPIWPSDPILGTNQVL